MSFFSFLGFSPQSHISFSYHAPLISSHLGQSLNLSLSFVGLDTFEVYWPVILKNVPQFGFIWYFLMITLCIFDKTTRGDVLFSLHQYQGVHHLSLSYGWWCHPSSSITCLRWCLLGAVNSLLVWVLGQILWDYVCKYPVSSHRV